MAKNKLIDYGYCPNNEYQELEDLIQESVDLNFIVKNFRTKEPCCDCPDRCLGMPDYCEKAIYEPGTRPHEIKERVENMIANDKNRKYLDPVEYCQFEDSIFGIKWHEMRKRKL